MAAKQTTMRLSAREQRTIEAYRLISPAGRKAINKLLAVFPRRAALAHKRAETR